MLDFLTRLFAAFITVPLILILGWLIIIVTAIGSLAYMSYIVLTSMVVYIVEGK